FKGKNNIVPQNIFQAVYHFDIVDIGYIQYDQISNTIGIQIIALNGHIHVARYFYKGYFFWSFGVRIIYDMDPFIFLIDKYIFVVDIYFAGFIHRDGSYDIYSTFKIGHTDR